MDTERRNVVWAWLWLLAALLLSAAAVVAIVGVFQFNAPGAPQTLAVCVAVLMLLALGLGAFMVWFRRHGRLPNMSWQRLDVGLLCAAGVIAIVAAIWHQWFDLGIAILVGIGPILRLGARRDLWHM
jgi:hypothetical protein